MRYLGWLVAIGMIGAAFLWRERGNDARIKQLEQERDSLAVVGRGLDTLYTADTIRLTRTRTVTDSILKTDTVFTQVEVQKIVYRERVACDAAIGTCEAEKANLRSQIGNLEKQIEHIKPSRFGCAVGASVNQKGFGPGATCGIRF